MANYKINEKSKTISVSASLTEIERGIISTYILNGYKVKEKRDAAARVSNNDIIAYFRKNDDKNGEKEFEAKKKAKITDKNGKEREAGFLVALKWFKENHAAAYEKIKDSKKK